MKSSVYVLSLCVVLAALLNVCFSGNNWRPQGRFGKRRSTSLLDARPHFGLSRLQDLPVELFFSKQDLASSLDKPQLCSISGLRGYPVCDFVKPSQSRPNNELLNTLYELK